MRSRTHMSRTAPWRDVRLWREVPVRTVLRNRVTDAVMQVTHRDGENVHGWSGSKWLRFPLESRVAWDRWQVVEWGLTAAVG